MLIRIDPGSPLGLAEQIAGRIRGQLADGTLRAGDRLPPARDLASGLAVNMHTVLRAYAALRDEGLIELRRGRGAYVAADTTSHLARLRSQIVDLVDLSASLGLSRDQLMDEIRKASR
jgi:GntR family transcriptional regulator